MEIRDQNYIDIINRIQECRAVGAPVVLLSIDRVLGEDGGWTDTVKAHGALHTGMEFQGMVSNVYHALIKSSTTNNHVLNINLPPIGGPQE